VSIIHDILPDMSNYLSFMIVLVAGWVKNRLETSGWRLQVSESKGPSSRKVELLHVRSFQVERI